MPCRYSYRAIAGRTGSALIRCLCSQNNSLLINSPSELGAILAMHSADWNAVQHYHFCEYLGVALLRLAVGKVAYDFE